MRIQKSSAASFLQILFCLATLFGSCAAALAQAGRGGISGIVADSSGAIIPGASVTATNTATSSKLSTVTTGAGLYSFVSLAPGTYQIRARSATTSPTSAFRLRSLRKRSTSCFRL